MSSISALNSLLSGSSSTGIDLSEILEAALGASTPGIDVNQAVSAAVTAAQAPETTWENQITTLESQASALNSIQTDAENLDTDMQSLNSLTGPLAATSVTSSNSSVVTATAASGAALGDAVVEVSKLAATDSWSSDTLSSSSAVVPAGNFTITASDGTTTTITSDGTDTLSDLQDQINGDNLGVHASVITDATGSRLSITSDTSGSAANFTVSQSGSSGLNFSESVTGANASLKVNGVQITSASNTVTGVLPGVTLNLLSTNDSPVTLAVSPNTSQASTAINQFVSDYNTLIQAVNAQYSDSGSGEGVLAEDPTIRTLQSTLMSALSYVYAPSSGSTTVSNLSDLGITVQKDGTLSVDSSTLNSVLENNFNDVQSFFQGTALNGFANSLDQQLTSFVSPDAGAFTVDLQSINTQGNDLETDINNFQNNVIAPLQQRLQTEYSQAEASLQQLPNQIKDIDEELGINTSSSS